MITININGENHVVHENVFQYISNSQKALVVFKNEYNRRVEEKKKYEAILKELVPIILKVVPIVGMFQDGFSPMDIPKLMKIPSQFSEDDFAGLGMALLESQNELVESGVITENQIEQFLAAFKKD